LNLPGAGQLLRAPMFVVIAVVLLIAAIVLVLVARAQRGS
jgi:hypothetical protein